MPSIFASGYKNAMFSDKLLEEINSPPPYPRPKAGEKILDVRFTS
jgi:hypothetical protein